MAASLLAVVVDCRDPSALARFWATALAREVAERNSDEFLVRDLTEASTPLYFMKVPEPKVTKNRLHIDVLTDGPMEDEVRRLADAGAACIEVRQDPDTLSNPDTWTVMTDPEGNEFCVTSSATLTGWT